MTVWTTKKEWWKSKTIVAAAAALLVAVVTAAYGETSPLTAAVIAVLSAFGIYGRVSARSEIKA